ncbi:MAG: hypothetical protein E7291_08045 [Lachnospiraceae bacterium]|nr:hypothetical protein [Lachnospiraceae bacterium]
MTKEQIKELVRERLSGRRIILFGAGEVAEAFYQEHKGELNISHCVSNLKKEWGKDALLGELDVKEYRREEIEENDYIVVCGAMAFRTIELQLKSDGQEMYSDFVESNIAAAIYSGKKIALFYGQCVLRDIYECICKVPSFNKEYVCVRSRTVKGQAIVINRLVYYMKDICDLYVYTPKILDRDSAYSLDLDELPSDCKVLSLSNLLLPLYWPQITTELDVYNKYYLHPYNVDRNIEHAHTLYRREDININRMVEEGKTTKEIVECLSSEDYYSEKKVINHIIYTLKMIDIAEAKIDIKVGDFIRANYKKKLLYSNFMHPNKCIIWEYIRRLLRGIGISDAEVDELERESPNHLHEGGDVPIYPSVAKYLQLEFVDKNTQYEVMVENGMVQMTFEEYMEHYVEYTKKAMEIMQMW